MIGIRSIVAVAADQSLDTSTVLIDVTGISYSLAAGKTCRIRLWIPFALAGTASGAKFQVVPPTTPTYFNLSWQLYDGNSTGTLAAFNVQTTSAAFSNALAHANNMLMTAEGYITANTAGTVKLQFAQLVSDGSAITILKGGTMDILQL